MGPGVARHRVGPRFIGLHSDDRFLHAANEESDTIVRRRVDRADGSLRDPALVARTGSPTCILFRPVGAPLP